MEKTGNGIGRNDEEARQDNMQGPKTSFRRWEKGSVPGTRKIDCAPHLATESLHVRVLRRDVARFAKDIITNLCFKASPGWISRFMRRHKFVTRVKTTAGQSLPKNVSERIVDYVTTCSKRIRRNQLPLPCIANMDETAIWADMPGNSTIEVRGAHIGLGIDWGVAIDNCPIIKYQQR